MSEYLHKYIDILYSSKSGEGLNFPCSMGPEAVLHSGHYVEPNYFTSSHKHYLSWAKLLTEAWLLNLLKTKSVFELWPNPKHIWKPNEKHVMFDQSIKNHLKHMCTVVILKGTVRMRKSNTQLPSPVIPLVPLLWTEEKWRFMTEWGSVCATVKVRLLKVDEHHHFNLFKSTYITNSC